MLFRSFNGTFVAKTYLSNIDGVGFQFTKKSTNTGNFTDQRTRLNYTAKASDDLKLVTQFEMQTYWGDVPTGGDVDTDGNNLVVRYAHLDFNLGKALNVKVGQQLFKDKIGGLYADADLPMVMTTYKQGGYTLGLGYSRFNDEASTDGSSYKGDLASDLYVLENTYAFNKDSRVSLVYYLNADNSTTVTNTYTGAVDVVTGLPAVATTVIAETNKKINTLALAGQTKIGALDLSGFAAMQKGYSHAGATKVSYHGWAANVLAKMKLGAGQARTGFLFTSGDNTLPGGSNHGWQTINQNGSAVVQNSYNESGMMLMVRNTSMGGTSNDFYLRKPITNIALLHAGYNADLTEKLYANGNVGMAWLPASRYERGTAGSNINGGSDILGTELNVEVGYKLYKNLTLKAQAAYVMLGGAYDKIATSSAGVANSADPADPFTLRLGAFYTF